MSIQWNNSREVIQRIYITGELELETPAHFGNGDAERLTDIPLQRDPLDGKTPLLSGSSIAGALRNELREREKGYHWVENPSLKEKSLAEALFGCMDDIAPMPETQETTRASLESWLMIDDALGTPPAKGDHTELRDGVAIDATTRTARMVGEDDKKRGQKYDIELLAAGTTFRLSFEFWLTEQNGHLLPALGAALLALEEGRIQLGSRKRRGFGQCRVKRWTIWRYAMGKREGIQGWLHHDPDIGGKEGSSILSLLAVGPQELSPDARKAFVVDAHFDLAGSLLIRSEGQLQDGPDVIHLQSWRNGDATPVLPGTSVAGVMRSRALRIAQTVHPEDGKKFVDELFGRDVHLAEKEDREPTGSRVRVFETVIEGGVNDLVQNRVKIDRFTGGAYPQALFAEQALWGNAIIRLRFSLTQAHDEEETAFQARIGLLLLVLKDLWTGDLPVGGGGSIGRGVLAGRRADLTYAKDQWTLQSKGEDALTLKGSSQEFLENCVSAFCSWQPKEVKHDKR